MEQYQIDQGIRLKNLIQALNQNQTTFAKSLGMAQPNINRMISGRNQVSVEVLNRISIVYKWVNLHWLLTGDGEMFFYEEEEKNPEVNEVSGIKDKWEELDERVERLEETVKKMIVEIRTKT